MSNYLYVVSVGKIAMALIKFEASSLKTFLDKKNPNEYVSK
jgi:hypothetical protein